MKTITNPPWVFTPCSLSYIPSYTVGDFLQFRTVGRTPRRNWKSSSFPQTGTIIPKNNVMGKLCDRQQDCSYAGHAPGRPASHPIPLTIPLRYPWELLTHNLVLFFCIRCVKDYDRATGLHGWSVDATYDERERALHRNRTKTCTMCTQCIEVGDDIIHSYAISS